MLKQTAILGCALVLCVSCSDDDNSDGTLNTESAATTYAFERNGESSVNIEDQTTQIVMAEAIIDALKDETATEAEIKAMFDHIEGTANFSEPELNASDENIEDNTANPEEFEGFIDDQIEARANADNINGASEGIAGEFSDGGTIRFANEKGLEMDQVFNKGLIGALMVHQMFNNLSDIDSEDNAAIITEKDAAYTAMEHNWDEVFGYVFGTATSLEDPIATVGDDDDFLNKYIGRVEDDPDFAGIANNIFQALVLGRQAIVEEDFDTLNEQGQRLRTLISQVIGVRAVFYLQQGKNIIEQAEDITDPTDSNEIRNDAFHDLSEGYGFIYSLQFTTDAAGNALFTKAEVDQFLAQLDGSANTDNGLWDITPETLQTLSETIAAKFSFTVEEAGSLD